MHIYGNGGTGTYTIAADANHFIYAPGQGYSSVTTGTTIEVSLDEDIILFSRDTEIDVIGGSWTTTHSLAPTFTSPVTVPDATAPGEAVNLGQANTLYAPIGFSSTFEYSANQTLTTAQSGSMIIFSGSAAATFTLPAPVQGLQYKILNDSSFTLTLNSISGNFVGLGLNGTNTPSLTIDQSFTHVSLIWNGSSWFYTCTRQIPQLYIPSRAINTVYTNSSNQNILWSLCVETTTAGGQQTNVTVDINSNAFDVGVTINRAPSVANAVITNAFIVPPGATYELPQVSGIATAIQGWTETYF